MAWGDISRFWVVKYCPNISILGKIFEEGRLTPPRGIFITICYIPGAPLVVWAVALLVGGQAPFVVVSLNHFTPKRFWGTFWP